MATNKLLQLENLPLWITFKAKAAPSEIHLVSRLIENAMDLLERIIETFPTYTLHNGIHQLNVIALMGELLRSEGLEKLTSLESALLLLSAYYHDIGMVFSEDEREGLKTEADFADFLDANPDAKLSIYENENLSIDTAEWYCRWAHAKRVHRFLSLIPANELKWGGISLKVNLGELCESHNENVEVLKEERFNTSLLGEADLKFCAIILRLADILDFDNSRSPNSVYKYLNLSNSKTKRETISDIEWRKHLCSQGFKFNQSQDGEIDFVAGPEDPAIEYDVRKFLDIIELELSKCINCLNFCSAKWRNFYFPSKINRNNIISQNYQYGDFKFQLDQGQVLDLLMGENLYDNRFVFIRELLQNAIDTSRHREFHERSKGNTAFKSKPIEVVDWLDQDGYRWVRIDDYGMGMTKESILNYLLKVGKSYYNSSEFKLEKQTYSNKESSDFTPISRFGIGILSCFIVGDKVEINTHSANSKKLNESKIRMSLSGLHNFYFLQTARDSPINMVNKYSKDEGYRDTFGTSIAVRLDARKEHIGLDISNMLKSIIFNSPIDISYNDLIVNREMDSFIRQPLCEYTIITLPVEDIERVNRFLEDTEGGKIQIEVTPLNLNNHSTCPKYLEGQVVIIKLIIPEKYTDQSSKFSFRLIPVDNFEKNADLKIELIKKYKNDEKKDIEERQSISCNQLSSILKIFPILNAGNNLIISHNGIRLSSQAESCYGQEINFELNNNVFDQGLYNGYNHHFFNPIMFGFISLKDLLRPNISVSRDKVKPLPWNVYSNIALSFYRAFLNSPTKHVKLFSVSIFKNLLDYKNDTLGDLMKDCLLTKNNGWLKEKIFLNVSIDQLKKHVQENGEIKVSYNLFDYDDAFSSLLARFIIISNFEVYIKVDTYHFEFILRERTSQIKKGLWSFIPMYFVKYENSASLIFSKSNVSHFINECHPFSQWLINNSEILRAKYLGIIESILDNLNIARNNCYDKDHEYSQVNCITKINKALERISVLERDDSIAPKSIHLKTEDFS